MSRATGVGTLAEPAPLAIDKVEPNHIQTLFAILQSIVRKLNGKLSLGDGVAGTIAGNFDGEPLDVYFPSANTPVTIRHTLNRVPVGYWVVRQDRACSVYDAADQSWSEQTLRLWSDVAGASVKLLLF